MDNMKQRYFFSSPPNQSVAIRQCGLTIYEKGQEVKTALYNDYAIHFILSGKGTYKMNPGNIFTQASADLMRRRL